jgi:hypothetical protein
MKLASLYVFPLIVCLFTLTAAAQCPDHWLPGQGIPGQGIPGLNGTVYAITTWDPDGPGPQPKLLVVGGSFTVAGDVQAANIAAWDGSACSPWAAG